MTHKTITALLDLMEAYIWQECNSDNEMQDSLDYIYDNGDTSIIATLVHDHSGIYHVTEVGTDSYLCRQHPRIAEALEGKTIDLSDLYREVERRQEDEALMESDPYAFYGVSRGDFL